MHFNMWGYIISLYIILLFITGFEASPCKELSFEASKTVCVCTEAYCDELELQDFTSKQSSKYETNSKGARFQGTVMNFTHEVDPGVPLIVINTSQTYQFILGFGGAFTDSTGINLKSISSTLQKQVMKSYFSKTGLEYNMGRIPIGSCDFSTHPYSYDDVENDFDLHHFNLSKEDFIFKIPFIQLAQSLSQEEMLFFGSPWSAPAWMKTNGAMNGQGALKGDPGGPYFKTWALYLLKFIQAYQSHNITLWGLTTQNEPSDGCISNFSFQSMCFPAEKMRDFLKKDLGPLLLRAGLGPENLKLMVLDDIRVFLPKWVDIVMSDPEAAQYVSGVAFHWYLEDLMPRSLVTVTRNHHPQLFYLASEACTGSYPWDIKKVILGDWGRAERYAKDIAQDLLNWSIGWIDWNLAVNMQGGPNWVKNFVDAPIIINEKEFYKQPMYYVLAQFSKCVPRGSICIGLEVSKLPSNIANKLDLVAFITPKNNIVVVAVNRNDKDVHVFIKDVTKGYLNITVTEHSVQSYIW